MNKEPVLPIKQIGESNWIEKLSAFLVNYDVDVIPVDDGNIFAEVEHNLEWIIPIYVKEYFLNFGGIESSDFMYNLKKVEDWQVLTGSIWEFISLYFKQDETDNYIVFSESIGNEPICFKKDTEEIYLFSHDPIKKAKVFKNFNDYLLNELIEIQKLYAEVTFDNSEEEWSYKADLLNGDGIDFDFRFMKL